MSNLNIIVKSDKCEFTNFFSEPITFPVEAEMALVKANLTVPVLAQQVITMPAVIGADYAKNWIAVTIDGVQHAFSWQDFYDGWNSIATGLEQSTGVTIAQFYDGSFEMFLNNPYCLVEVGAVDVEYKTSFQEAFANMCDAKFQFYAVTPLGNWVTNESKIYENLNYNVIGTQDLIRVENVTNTTWGIKAAYNPATIALLTPTNADADPNQFNNWQQNVSAGGPDLESIGSANTLGTYDCIYYGFKNTIDPNGGNLQFGKNVGGTNNCYIGLQYTVECRTAPAIPASIPTPDILNIGIEFTGGTFRIYDNGNYFPGAAKMNTFLATDDFFIAVQRDGLIGPNSNKFRVMIHQVVTGEDRSDDNIIYESTFTGPQNGNIEVFPVAVADGNGHIFTNQTTIPLQADSREQSTTLQLEEGVTYQGSIMMRPEIDAAQDLDIYSALTEMYTTLGLNMYLENANDGEITSETQYDNNALQLFWKRKINPVYGFIRYIVGPNDPRTDYTAPTSTNIQLSRSKSVSDLPRQLEVRVNNLTVKNFSGTQPDAQTTTSGTSREEGLNRIVGTIPTANPTNLTTNTEWDLSYEPYTPVYRPLNNTNAFATNQLNIEVSYKDFNTNTRRTIDNIDGHMVLEFHVRPSDKQPEINNNLRPY